MSFRSTTDYPGAAAADSRPQTTTWSPASGASRQQPPATMSGYHLRSRASGLLASGSNFLATRDWQGMANTVKQKVVDVGQYAQQQQHHHHQRRAAATATPTTSTSHRRSLRTSPSSDAPAFQPTPTNQGLSSLKSLKPGQETPVLLHGWVQRNVARDRHPQTWSQSDAPEDLDDGEIELQVSIDGFVSKMLESPTRSQRLFNQMARQLAALPRLPAAVVGTRPWDSSVQLTEESMDVSGTLQQQQQHAQHPGEGSEEELHGFRDKAISKLMEGADEETLVRLMENLGAFPTEASSIEAASKLEGRAPHAERGSSNSANDDKAARVTVGHLDVPDGFQRPTRQATASSTSSTASTMGGSPYWADRSLEELHKLHHNLDERLRSYWIYRSGHRDVHIEIAPVVRGQVMRASDGERSLLATTRLTTDSTGQYTHRLVIPWHMLSGFCGFHTSSGLAVKPDEIEGVEVRAVLPPHPSSSSSLLSGPPAAAAGAEAEADENATPWLRYAITEDDKRKVRVISDIDDTVKHTGVLQGAKRILRNVFVLPFEEVEVPGVAAWYQEMVSMGVGLHYVTNAPLELHRLVSEFLAAVKLPLGHLTLKHYPSGTRSLLASWLEPAGERKRANIVRILNEFRQSQFILIGDSGELDLELYTALAAERPEQIRGIFIRDVSSPRPEVGAGGLGGAGGVAAGAGGEGGGGGGASAQGRMGKMEADETLAPPVPAFSSAGGDGQGPTTSPTSAFFQPGYPPPAPSASAASATAATPHAPIPTQGITEAELKRKQAFQARLLRATAMVPSTTLFRLFYTGHDVCDEAKRLVKQLQASE
ncbi:hypothetical protein ACQY0O_005059 [Thecaphora frezii]